ncbi:MAG: type III pantothenate kinase [Verrucomicrobiae bacterium]
MKTTPLKPPPAAAKLSPEVRRHAVPKPVDPRGTFLLVDISNSFVKLALAGNGRIGRVHRLATKTLEAAQIAAVIGGQPLAGTVAASVVPKKNRAVDAACGAGVCWIGPDVRLGVGIDYPNPRGIGPDRLANAAGCAAHHGVPAIVVDFGTAVTFDVISPEGNYIGGVIAPGLNAMTEYLHDRTALLPLIRLREPGSAVGRTTEEAMLSGAVHGYRGLVAEIIRQIRREAFPHYRPKIVATGGDSTLIASGLPVFDAVDPLLTLRGLLVAARLNFQEA